LEAGSHIVQFYIDDEHLAGGIGDLMFQALLSQQSTIVIGTRAHRATIDSLLMERLADFSQLRDAGRYLAIDAAAMLAKFTNHTGVDESRFHRLASAMIERAIERSADGSVLIFGEMVGLLCASHDMARALELEQCWNRQRQTHQFDLVCAYPLSGFTSASGANDLMRVCSEHALAIPAEGPF
jgi:hypothetical protein